ncbi:hypothetical protein DMA11_09830 [Marinilabiliaceae bacterium JC017]|nr:hypothetical protein DMA11_09830 [Marinilabiliaceae bacterium JC017]
MPLFKLSTNKSIDSQKQQEFLQKASSLIAEKLGKNEQYVMTLCVPGLPMTFSGKEEHCAYCELKSIGLQPNQTPVLSKAISLLIEEELNIPSERIYIEFSNAERAYWGWNKSTF